MMQITHLSQMEKDFQTNEKILGSTHSQQSTKKTMQEQGGLPSDTVLLSDAGQAAKSNAPVQAVTKTASIQLLGQGKNRRLCFTNAADLQEAVKNGYVELNGQQYFLSDSIKKALTAKDKAMQKLQQDTATANMLACQATNAQRQGESMQKSAQKESRIIQTVARIMHGRKVSPTDEKELAEFSPDLYSLAKSAGALEQHKHSRQEEEEYRKISKQNDNDRQWEESPSSIPDPIETPIPDYRVEAELPENDIDIQA